MKQVIDERYYQCVIVTDRDLALVRAVREEFPNAHKLLCRWHINQNILKFCRNKFTDGVNEYDEVKKRWDWMVKAPTFESFERRYQRLQQLLVNHQGT